MPNIAFIGSKPIPITVTGVIVSPVPAVPIHQESIPFTDSLGNEEMDLDGTITPIDFEVAPPLGEVWYVEEVACGLDDVGNLGPDNYGGISGPLSNGTHFLKTLTGVEKTIRLFKKNTDIALTFNTGVGTFNPGGFLDSSKTFIGKIEFSTNIKLNGSLGDRLVMRVQDNLNGLLWHRAAAQIFRILA